MLLAWSAAARPPSGSALARSGSGSSDSSAGAAAAAKQQCHRRRPAVAACSAALQVRVPTITRPVPASSRPRSAAGGAASAPGGPANSGVVIPRVHRVLPTRAHSRGKLSSVRRAEAAPEVQIGQDDTFLWIDLFSTSHTEGGPQSLSTSMYGLPFGLAAIRHTVAVLDPWAAPAALRCAGSIYEIAVSTRLAAQGLCKLAFVIPSDHRPEFVATVLEGEDCCNEARRLVSQIELSLGKLSKPVDPAALALGLRMLSAGGGDAVVTEMIQADLRSWIRDAAKAEVQQRVHRGVGRLWDDVIATNFLRILIDQAWCAVACCPRSLCACSTCVFHLCIPILIVCCC